MYREPSHNSESTQWRKLRIYLLSSILKIKDIIYTKIPKKIKKKKITKHINKWYDNRKHWTAPGYALVERNVKISRRPSGGHQPLWTAPGHTLVEGNVQNQGGADFLETLTQRRPSTVTGYLLILDLKITGLDKEINNIRIINNVSLILVRK